MTNLTPEALAELQRLLDEYPKAVGFHDVTEAWFGLARAAVKALPALLDAVAERDALAEWRDFSEAERDALTAKLAAVEDALNDAILYENEARDALARQTPVLLAAEAALARVRELHARESFWQYHRDQEHSYPTQQDAADESGCDCPEDPESVYLAHTPECLATISHFDVCSECARIEYADAERQAHGEFSGYAEALWPCPTIRALDATPGAES